jgi:hypothetical protein
VKGFRRVEGNACLELPAIFAAELANLATQLAALISERDSHVSDAALERLLPDAYRGRDEDAAEFRRFTEEELSDEKVRGALTIAEHLASDGSSDTVSITLDPQESFLWLRSLTDIRLVLANRIGIDDSGEPAEYDEQLDYAWAIYVWLGDLQESLVRVVNH